MDPHHAKLFWATYLPVQGFGFFLYNNAVYRQVMLQQTKLSCPYSINLLHLGCLICGAFHFLKWREVIIITQAFIVIINAQPKLDHAVNAACELRGLIKIEARSEQGGVEKQPDQIFHGLV